jgi:hypothetical protein
LPAPPQAPTESKGTLTAMTSLDFKLAAIEVCKIAFAERQQ